MFKKFTDTLSGTIDAVKTYGTSVLTTQDGDEKPKPAGAATTTTADVEKPSPTEGTGDTFRTPAKKPNNFFGFSTQPQQPSNPIIAQTSHLHVPALGRGVDSGESRIQHMEEMDMRQTRVVNSVEVRREHRPGMEHMPKLIRSNTDDLIDKEFEEAKCKLDDVLDVPVDSDTELAPKSADGKDKKKKPKKRISENSCLGKLTACIQDDHVRRGKTEPSELLDKPDQNVLLKKVLNIIFILCGILLFVAVVVVIIYTATVSSDEPEEVLTTEDPGWGTTTEY